MKGGLRMIDGVEVKQLSLIPDERGYLMEMLRCDDEIFDQFGQVYVSAVYQDVVKGWHCHHEQTDFVVCVSGMIKLVMYDAREDSPTNNDVNELYLGEQKRILVKIPTRVYHGWKGITPGASLVVNCPDRPYRYENPDEHRIDPHSADIPYTWERQDQ